MRKQIRTVFAWALFLALAPLMWGCGSDEPSPMTQTQTEYRLEINDNFLKYFTVLATYTNDQGKEVTTGVNTSPFVASRIFKSLPVEYGIKLQFIRNNEANPTSAITFHYVLTKKVTITFSGSPETTQRGEEFNYTPNPQDFDTWADQMAARQYSYTITVDKNGVAKF